MFYEAEVIILLNAADGSGKIRIGIDHQTYKLTIMTRTIMLLGRKHPLQVSWVNERKGMGINGSRDMGEGGGRKYEIKRRFFLFF